jgi:membrane associated rhomboid family serine protease
MNVLQQNKRRKIRLGEDNNALVWLIIINVVVFVALGFIKIIYQSINDKDFIALQLFHSQIFDWFSLPANAAKFFVRPWTIFSYMFTHDGFMFLLSSLLWLWSFGYILQDLSGNNKLVPVYLYGGFAGGIFFLLAANILPHINHTMVSEGSFYGAGTAITAIAIATTTLAPKYKIFPMISGGISLWVLTLVYVSILYLSIGASSLPVAIAHLAAGTVGFIYVKQLQRGNDTGKWMNELVAWCDNIFNPEKKITRIKQQQHFYKATRIPFEKKMHFTQQKLDDILDKINREGYHFLTAEEKEFLKKASREDF